MGCRPAPDPGHLAWLDQWDSACAHAGRSAVALASCCKGRLFEPSAQTGPWAWDLVESVTARPGGGRLLCAHLAVRVGPCPSFVTVRNLLTCYTCLPLAVESRNTCPDGCDRCGRSRNCRIVVARHDTVVAVGLLCAGCLAVELAVTR